MSLPAAMKALVISSYGSWEAASVAEAPMPQVGPHDVLIRAEASALNFPDLLMIEGKYQVRPPAPFVPGRDVAGTVVAIGASVTTFAVGHRVAAQPQYGAFAEYVAAPDWTCTRLPDAVDFVDAAACGTVFATVVGAVKLRAKLQPSETVLITGAAGGVGSAGIQFARFLGGRVVALVSSQEKEDAARRLGAEIVLRSDRMGDMKTGMRAALNEAGLDGVDAVIDVVGGSTFDGAIRCLVPGGRYVIVGFASGNIPFIPANYVLLKDLIVLGSSLDRLFKTGDPGLRGGMEEAFRALAEGHLKAEIESVLPFSRFAEAASRIANRQAVGKILLKEF